MKKVFAIVALVAAMFVAGNAQAQTTVNIGYSPETFKTSYNSNSSNVNFQGFHVGFTTNVKLVQDLGIAAGAQFRMNMNSESELSGTVKTKDTQMLIDVPVLINYSININNNFAITPFVGPMVSFAVLGKTNTKTFAGSTELTDTDYNWYGEDSDFKRFNLYGVFGANVRFSNFNLYGGYRLGMLNLLKDSGEVTMKTNGFFVGLGFTL